MITLIQLAVLFVTLLLVPVSGMPWGLKEPLGRWGAMGQSNRGMSQPALYAHFHSYIWTGKLNSQIPQ